MSVRRVHSVKVTEQRAREIVYAYLKFDAPELTMEMVNRYTISEVKEVLKQFNQSATNKIYIR